MYVNHGCSFINKESEWNKFIYEAHGEIKKSILMTPIIQTFKFFNKRSCSIKGRICRNIPFQICFHGWNHQGTLSYCFIMEHKINNTFPHYYAFIGKQYHLYRISIITEIDELENEKLNLISYSGFFQKKNNRNYLYRFFNWIQRSLRNRELLNAFYITFNELMKN